MDVSFLTSFSPVFKAVFSIFLIILASGLLVRFKIISQENIKSLSVATINVFYPCLIFSKVLKNFNPVEFHYWWLMPLSSIAMILIAMAISALLFFKELPGKKNMIALSSLMNAGYLVLPVGQMLYPNQFDEFASLCFLFILGLSPVLWSVGKFLVTSEAGEKMTFKSLATPPFVANLFAVLLVLTNLKLFVPNIIITTTSFLGNATVPLATFILGATLGSISFKIWPSVWDVLRVVSVKFIIIPIITIFVLSLTNLRAEYPLLADLFVIQSAVAPAANIIIQIRKYGGDKQKVGSVMFISYLICLISIPLWLSIWRIMG
jgi:predicted permease